MSQPRSLALERRRFTLAARTAVALCVVFAVLLQEGFPLAVRQGASGLGLLVAGVLAATSCGLRAARTAGRRRRSWRLLMAAGVVADRKSVV